MLLCLSLLAAACGGDDDDDEAEEPEETGTTLEEEGEGEGDTAAGGELVDLGTFVGMSASMILIGMLASYVPARRASRVDPIESLRGD